MEVLQILRDALEKFRTWFTTDKTIASIKTLLLKLKTLIVNETIAISRWVGTRKRPVFISEAKLNKWKNRFKKWRNEYEFLLIPMIIISVFFGGVIIAGLLVRNERSFDLVKERMEYRQDTIFFKMGDTAFGFSGTEIDTLKIYFHRANRLKKYCKRHVDEDYEVLLGELAGVKLEFSYSSSPWNMSSIDMTIANESWYSGMVIVHPRKDFMKYFTKYPRVYKKVVRKRKRKAKKLNRLLTI